MMRVTRRGFVGCLCCAAVPGLAAAAVAQPDPGAPQHLELGTPAMTRLAPTVWVAEIAPGVWLHTTTGVLDDGMYYPANGLILDRAGGAVLIDTGWNPAQAAVLLHWCAARGRPVGEAVATHFHGDRTGGIPALAQAGIRTMALGLTCELARRGGKPVPLAIAGWTGGAYAMAADLALFFPGGGHTRDNIVVWLPGQRVLYGGCFLKSATVSDLGYVDDAVIADWPGSLRRVRAAYPAPAIVVPGHGTIHGDSMGATARLLARV